MASRARWASLLSYILVAFLGFLIAWQISSVPRAPLPRDELAAIGALRTESPWPRARISVSILDGAFPADSQRQEFLSELRKALEANDAEVIEEELRDRSWSSESPCISAGVDFSVEACLSDLASSPPSSNASAAAAAAALRSAYSLLVAPGGAGSAGPALLLDAGRGAVLRARLDGAISTPQLLARAVASRLKETWLRRVQLHEVNALFEVAPAYVYSFFLVGDCETRIAWDFRPDVLGPFLGRFLERLRLLVDVEIDAQVVQCGSIVGPSSTVTAAALQEDFLRRAGSWPGDTVTRRAQWLPPLVRFATFKPSSPLRLLDESGNAQSSFAVQGWGAVAVVGASEDSSNTSCSAGEAPVVCGGGEGGVGAGASMLTPCEAKQAASAWVSSLRSWLMLPLDGTLDSFSASMPGGEGLALHGVAPSINGISDWELLLVARAIHSYFLRRTVETLENLIELVDSLPEVVVRAEIGDIVFQATADARRSAALAETGDLPAALAAARRALAAALAAQHDETIVAQMFFSTEFKYAVYLPIAMPILLPIVVSVTRQIRKSMDLKKAAKAKAASELEATAVAEKVE